MSWGVPVSLAALLLLSGEMLGGAGAVAASGRYRSGHRLVTAAAPPLHQLQVNSLIQCLGLCGRHSSCVAINFGAVSETTNCQLLGQRACDGLPLVADTAVDYYDVYDDRQNLTAETQTPFWDDPSCVEEGYCASECAAEAAGQFCAGDAHCHVKLKPPGGYQCVGRICQPAPNFWELRPGLALPRWQLWRMDWRVWTWKRLKPGTCSLDISVKLGGGAEISIVPTWSDDRDGMRLSFRFTYAKTDLFYKDASGNTKWLAQDATTPDIVNSETFTRLKISWCEGLMTIGPEDNPTMVTGQAAITQPIDFVKAYSDHAPSWMYVDSGVADPWLFEDSGVAEDAVMVIAPEAYVYRNITVTNDVTVKYDCMAQTDCSVALQGDAATPRILVIYVGLSKDKSLLLYFGDINTVSQTVTTGPVLSSTEYNTFTVRYNNGLVTIHRNDAANPIYSVNAPHLITVKAVGIGGCCSRKYIRVARYDPAWRTDTWLTEGRGYSNGDTLE
ncbi:hypothetical protein FJT64_025273 [Amphibalanus amphitrite]|uniref:Apple domain-containing protein n=1 Tax=Amphibalanus amphitrite TaxID=1232801 RepID=A0A6A4W811_AMPAM|nr:hypothetical protein FJT64_025273 [Amphibalanus amphitrite]